MAKVLFILGGARSGKSRFAQQVAEQIAGADVTFIATAAAGDEEMLQRIAAHQRQRPRAWRTCEQPRDLSVALRENRSCRCIVIDCLTLLVSNVMLAAGTEAGDPGVQKAVENEIDALLQSCRGVAGTVIIVSSEVGGGVVPETRLGREFRDLLGRANQAVAAAATKVYYMIAGLAVEVKALATSAVDAARID